VAITTRTTIHEQDFIATKSFHCNKNKMLNTMEALGEDVFGENDQMFDKLNKNFSSLLLEVQRTHMHVQNPSKLISMDITTIQFLFYMHLKAQQ
jgi:hypothetical protein